MTVTTSLPVTGIVRNQADQSVKLSAVLNNRVATTTATDTSVLASQSARVDTTGAEQQYPPLNLRVDTLSVAVAGNTTETISNSSVQVSRLLDQLQSLATRAALGGLSEAALELLNGQFQALRLSISNVPPSPPNAVDVSGLLEKAGALDSSLGQEAVATKLVIGGLNNDKALLGDANIATADAAKAALTTIAQAQATVAAQRPLIARVQETIEFAAVSNESALQNQEALRSTLSEADLDGANSTSLIAALQAQSDAARAVQTNRLPNNVLQLLG